MIALYLLYLIIDVANTLFHQFLFLLNAYLDALIVLHLGPEPLKLVDVYLPVIKLLEDRVQIARRWITIQKSVHTISIVRLDSTLVSVLVALILLLKLVNIYCNLFP